MKTKTYYAPIPTFLVFVFYIVLGIVVFCNSIFSYSFLEMFSLSVLLISLLIARIVRFSYRLKIQDGKIHEYGLYTKHRILPIDTITKIHWQQQNFWTGGARTSGWIGNLDWQRQYYIESPECVLPEYPISAKLIKDLVKLRPDLVVEKKRLTFESPFKKNL